MYVQYVQDTLEYYLYSYKWKWACMPQFPATTIAIDCVHEREQCRPPATGGRELTT